MDLEEERMTSLMDNRGMLTVMSPWAWLPFGSVGSTSGWHSNNHGPNDWNHPAISKWQESDVITDQTTLMFLVFDWGSDPGTHSGRELSDTTAAVFSGIEHVTF